MAELAQSKPQTELVIALGREEREQARPKGAQRYPHTLAMQAKFQAEEGRAAYRKRKWIAEPLDGWIKNVLGFRQFSMRGLKPLRMQALQKPRDRQTALLHRNAALTRGSNPLRHRLSQSQSVCRPDS